MIIILYNFHNPSIQLLEEESSNPYIVKKDIVQIYFPQIYSLLSNVT